MTTWTREQARRLRKQVTPRIREVIDYLAKHPDARHSRASLVRALDLDGPNVLRGLLGELTKAAKRAGIEQEEPNSWFVHWRDAEDYEFWLDAERAAWWLAGDSWSEEELRASVEAYREMQRLEREGQPFTKKSFYRYLAAKFGRTEKAFEYRAQNISRVLELQGRAWIKGLVPARNIGKAKTAQLEQLLADLDERPNPRSAEDQAEVRAGLRGRVPFAKPTGNRKPTATTSSATSFQRDPRVVIWTRRRANGVCESCAEPAPFCDSDGNPHLEVHHVRTLADGGSDTVENAVAVCPNCHSALHYAADREQRTARLYENVDGLVKE